MYKIYEKLRDERGLKDVDVARETGIAQATLSNWKNENYVPKLDKLLILANYFGVTIEEFIGNGQNTD